MKKNGYVPQSLPPEQSENVVQLLDKNERVIYQQHFTVPSKIWAEEVGANGELTGKFVPPPRPSFVLTLPWLTEASWVKVVNQDQTFITRSLLGIKTVDNEPDFDSAVGEELLNTGRKINIRAIRPAFAQGGGGKLHIAFIGHGYTDMGKFNTHVEKFSKPLLESEPFKSRASHIVFHKVNNTEDLKCAKPNGLLVCDRELVTKKVNTAGVPHFAIVVLVNNCSSVRAANDNGIIAIPDGSSSVVLVHEIGHSFNLIDEYLVSKSNGPLDNQTHIAKGASVDYPVGPGNCYAGNPPAAGWKQYGQVQYAKGCAYPNWYAPSIKSVMRQLDVSCFNPVSLDMINKGFQQLGIPVVKVEASAVCGGTKVQFACMAPWGSCPGKDEGPGAPIPETPGDCALPEAAPGGNKGGIGGGGGLEKKVVDRGKGVVGKIIEGDKKIAKGIGKVVEGGKKALDRGVGLIRRIINGGKSLAGKAINGGKKVIDGGKKAAGGVAKKVGCGIKSVFGGKC